MENIVFNGDVSASGDLVARQDAAINVKSIGLVENGTLAQVGGNLCSDLAETIFADCSTPRIHLDIPMRVQVNGDLSAGSSETHAENVKSNWCVKTEYLEATAGAISNQVGVSSNLAILNNKNLKVDRVRKDASKNHHS